MSVRGVLFDWRGTLFHDLPKHQWIRSSAALIGRTLSEVEIASVSAAIAAAENDPLVISQNRDADSSADRHREAGMFLLERAGIDAALAQAIYERDGQLDASLPYPDTPSVLKALKEREVKVGVVSDIHYDLRPIFAYYGLLDLVDAWSLSYVHGAVKPDVRAFELALRSLELRSNEVVMVGDNPRRDTGGVVLGIATLILPPGIDYATRGLDIALRL